MCTYSTDLLYQLALTQVPHIGPVQARLLLEQFDTAEAVFRARRGDLERIEGIGTVRAASIKSFDRFAEQEAEIRFLEQRRITPLFLRDPSYPRRLLHCYDPPTLLFYRGTADLNAARVLAFIGTRNNTAYGKELVQQLMTELKSYAPLVISGLAYGIDALAHRQALQQQLPTVGVLAHGLDRLYPAAHSHLAREMLNGDGGLLTEFRSGTEPDRHHFPTRNRVVAGLCDAVVVVETGCKGGSMITAHLAHGYHRDVFALPGRTTDRASEGCLALIQRQQATLVTSGGGIPPQLGGGEPPVKQRPQRTLFPELSPDEKVVADVLQEVAVLHIDELHHRCSLPHSRVAAALLSLELQGLVECLPGKCYRWT